MLLQPEFILSGILYILIESLIPIDCDPDLFLIPRVLNFCSDLMPNTDVSILFEGRISEIGVLLPIDDFFRSFNDRGQRIKDHLVICKMRDQSSLRRINIILYSPF